MTTVVTDLSNLQPGQLIRLTVTYDRKRAIDQSRPLLRREAVYEGTFEKVLTERQSLDLHLSGSVVSRTANADETWTVEALGWPERTVAHLRGYHTEAMRDWEELVVWRDGKWRLNLQPQSSGWFDPPSPCDVTVLGVLS